MLSDIKASDTGKTYRSLDKYSTCLSILLDKVRFSETERKNLEFHERSRLLNEALQMEIKNGKEVTPDSVIKQYNALSKKYLKKDQVRYTLHGTFSVRSRIPIPSVRFAGAYISFSDITPKKLTLPEQMSLELTRYTDAYPREYVHVCVSVSARDPYSGFTKAYRIGNLYRGLWNLILNYRTSFFSFGSKQPVNKVVWGPVHTVHYSSGKPVSDSFGREGTWNKNILANDITQDLKALKQEEKRIRSSLAKCSYAREIESMIQQYALSLDEPYKAHAFRELWTVLESLTGSRGLKQSELVKRASFFRRNRGFCKLELEALKNIRNTIVHEGTYADDFEHYVNRLRTYVEHLLYALINHNSLFRDINDFRSFLSLTHDVDQLEERRNHIQFAMDLLKNG